MSGINQPKYHGITQRYKNRVPGNRTKYMSCMLLILNPTLNPNLAVSSLSNLNIVNISNIMKIKNVVIDHGFMNTLPSQSEFVAYGLYPVSFRKCRINVSYDNPVLKNGITVINNDKKKNIESIGAIIK